MDQWNRIKHPEINPCSYGHPILYRIAENMLGNDSGKAGDVED
jgi:hypothetical protein